MPNIMLHPKKGFMRTFIQFQEDIEKAKENWSECAGSSISYFVKTDMMNLPEVRVRMWACSSTERFFFIFAFENAFEDEWCVNHKEVKWEDEYCEIIFTFSHKQ